MLIMRPSETSSPYFPDLLRSGGSQIRFAQLARLHGARYRHTVIALDGNTEMAGRLAGMGVAIEPVTFDKTKTLQSWRGVPPETKETSAGHAGDI